MSLILGLGIASLLNATFVTMLFASATLVVPRGDDENTVDLADYFAANGKWGVALFGLVHLIALPLNQRLFGVPFIAPVNLLLAAMMAMIASVTIVKSLRVAQVLTVLALAVRLAILCITVAPSLRGEP